MFINTKGKNREDFSQEFLDFMEYITSSTDKVAENTESMRIKQIHATVRKIRISERMGVKYMQRWEEIAYARQDGRKEGEIAGENRFSELLQLLAAGRNGDLSRAILTGYTVSIYIGRTSYEIEKIIR